MYVCMCTSALMMMRVHVCVCACVFECTSVEVGLTSDVIPLEPSICFLSFFFFEFYFIDEGKWIPEKIPNLLFMVNSWYLARWCREAYDGTHIQMDITHALANALFRCQPFMLNFLSLTWHTTVLGYPKRRGALAVMTGGCVACTRKEKTRLSGPVGC